MINERKGIHFSLIRDAEERWVDTVADNFKAAVMPTIKPIVLKRDFINPFLYPFVNPIISKIANVMSISIIKWIGFLY